jgi:hypothetical protein
MNVMQFISSYYLPAGIPQILSKGIIAAKVDGFKEGLFNVKLCEK